MILTQADQKTLVLSMSDPAHIPAVKAFLEGTLETRASDTDTEWSPWTNPHPPAFDLPPCCYRPKPAAKKPLPIPKITFRNVLTGEVMEWPDKFLKKEQPAEPAVHPLLTEYAGRIADARACASESAYRKKIFGLMVSLWASAVGTLTGDEMKAIENIGDAARSGVTELYGQSFDPLGRTLSALGLTQEFRIKFLGGQRLLIYVPKPTPAAAEPKAEPEPNPALVACALMIKAIKQADRTINHVGGHSELALLNKHLSALNNNYANQALISDMEMEFNRHSDLTACLRLTMTDVATDAMVLWALERHTPSPEHASGFTDVERSAIGAIANAMQNPGVKTLWHIGGPGLHPIRTQTAEKLIEILGLDCQRFTFVDGPALGRRNVLSLIYSGGNPVATPEPESIPPASKRHPLHTDEVVESLKRLDGGYKANDLRMTGRTTARALQAIAKAIQAPRSDIPLRDHSDDAALAKTVNDIAIKLGMKHISTHYSPKGVFVRFGE